MCEIGVDGKILRVEENFVINSEDAHGSSFEVSHLCLFG